MTPHSGIVPVINSTSPDFHKASINPLDVLNVSSVLSVHNESDDDQSDSVASGSESEED